jgi:glucosamine-6-phosphate deaminase
MTNHPTLPQIVICPDASEASRSVAQIIADAVRSNPQIVLGLATGGTPLEAYRELIRMHREAELDFSDVHSFNLDEYLGLSPEHPQSYRFFMQQHLFDHINIDSAHARVPNGLVTDVLTHAQEYEQQIRAAGGIDMQLLGIGSNGHIAFNEPGSAIDSRTREIDLTADTIQANSRFFDSIDQVPRHAITMGIGTILEAKRIVLMATGQAKAEAVRLAIEADADPANPASLLQQHDDVTYVLDVAAAEHLTR